MIRAVELPWDMNEINGWLRERGDQSYDLSLMPGLGYIEPEVAAGFLIRTDAKIAFLEFFVSNPRADKVARAMALDEIAGKLISQAHESGIRIVTAITQHSAIIKLCKKHKLIKSDDQVFGRIF